MHIAIIGGGIVGLATAHELLRRRSDLSVTLLEKEPALAAHQTGHNSGVIHSGIYYKPGSAKARMCVRGGALLRRFCDDNGIRYAECGKVVVARTPEEIPRLDELLARGTANGVPRLAMLGAERLREIEPQATGLRALHVPTAAIVDYGEVCRALAARIEAAGGTIRTGTRVTAIEERAAEVVINGAMRFDFVVACAGLHSDRVARLSAGAAVPARIVPFRGEYYAVLRPDLVRGLVYPAPDPRFPFLGVHFTRTIGGGLEAGPNAVLAFAREGYRKRDVNLRDLAETLAYPGFWRLMSRVGRTAAGEVVRSLSRRAFTRALQSLVPAVESRDLVRAPAGVRAQALAPDGDLVDDFLFVERPRALHVCNAPSPAATASLAIAEEIASRVTSRS